MLGFERSNETWYQVQDDEPIKPATYGHWDPFTPVYPNLGCTFLQTDGYWSFRDKTSCSEMELCTMCVFHRTPVFTLKGNLCEEFSPFDWNFYFLVNDSYQIESYDGYKDSTFTNPNGHGWVGNAEGSKVARTDLSHPIGRKEWDLFSGRCSSMTYPVKRTLIMSMCEFSMEFTCNSGRCIPIEKRCDRIVDCDDESDEKECHLVYIPHHYKKIEVCI